MKRTFVFGDIHGRYEALIRLLEYAGIVEDGERVQDDFQVVSIGDLANVVAVDVNGDKECLTALKDGLIDIALIGNHEAPLIFPSMSFGGYYRDPEVGAVYNHLERMGKLVPSMLIGGTLLTHAGVHRYFDFLSPQEANDAINYVYENWSDLNGNNEEKFYFQNNIDIPKYMVLDAVSAKRGGGYPMGGILWADYDEPKNKNFSQIFGHTPTAKGPVLTEWKGTGIFHVNIDTAAKKGLLPTGVWLDEDGKIDQYVQPKTDPFVALRD